MKGGEKIGVIKVSLIFLLFTAQVWGYSEDQAESCKCIEIDWYKDIVDDLYSDGRPHVSCDQIEGHKRKEELVSLKED
ncbi:MAG: hypothetical protein RMJ45_08520 [Candidatus Calescibacterium sp.]|nr:hypothetical protein [Candidatus Calescibacterium sp.]